MRCTDWGEGFVAGAVAVLSVVNRIVGPQTREVEARECEARGYAPALGKGWGDERVRMDGRKEGGQSKFRSADRRRYATGRRIVSAGTRCCVCVEQKT